MPILTEEVINVEVIEETIEVTIENICTSGNGSGDMTKLIYDKDQDGVVDSSESLIIDVVATEDLPKYSLVTTTGEVADSNNPAHINRVAGITLSDITANTSGKVLRYGKIRNFNWSFTINAPLFLNVKSISQTPPSVGFLCNIGTVVNSNEILVDIQRSIKL